MAFLRYFGNTLLIVLKNFVFVISYFSFIARLQCTAADKCSKVISYPNLKMGNSTIYVPNAAMDFVCSFNLTIQDISDNHCILIKNDITHNQHCWTIMAGEKKCFNTCDRETHCNRQLYSKKIQLQIIPNNYTINRRLSMMGSITIQRCDNNIQHNSIVGKCFNFIINN